MKKKVCALYTEIAKWLKCQPSGAGNAFVIVPVQNSKI